MVSLYSSGWVWTYDYCASASRELIIQSCTTTPVPSLLTHLLMPDKSPRLISPVSKMLPIFPSLFSYYCRSFPCHPLSIDVYWELSCPKLIHHPDSNKRSIPILYSLIQVTQSMHAHLWLEFVFLPEAVRPTFLCVSFLDVSLSIYFVGSTCWPLDLAWRQSF